MVTYKGKPVRDPVTLGWLYEQFGDKIESTFKDWSGNLEDLPDNMLAQIQEQLNVRVALEHAKQLEAGVTVDVKPEPLLNTRR